MRFPRIFTPSESRLAALLFILAALGSLTRLGRDLNPEIQAWLMGSRSLDSAAALDSLVPVHEKAGMDTLIGSSPSREPDGESDTDPLLINPNLADTATLVKLPGVGPVLAGRILEDRLQNGAYRTPEDLLRVKGIGTTILERIRPFLKLP